MSIFDAIFGIVKVVGKRGSYRQDYREEECMKFSLKDQAVLNKKNFVAPPIPGVNAPKDLK